MICYAVYEEGVCGRRGGPLSMIFMQGEFFQLYGNDEFLMTCSSSIGDEELVAADLARSVNHMTCD